MAVRLHRKGPRTEASYRGDQVAYWLAEHLLADGGSTRDASAEPRHSAASLGRRGRILETGAYTCAWAGPPPRPPTSARLGHVSATTAPRPGLSSLWASGSTRRATVGMVPHCPSHAHVTVTGRGRGQLHGPRRRLIAFGNRSRSHSCGALFESPGGPAATLPREPSARGGFAAHWSSRLWPLRS